MAEPIKSPLYRSDPNKQAPVEDVYQKGILERTKETIQQNAEESVTDNPITDYNKEIEEDPKVVSRDIDKSIVSDSDGLHLDFSHMQNKIESSFTSSNAIAASIANINGTGDGGSGGSAKGGLSGLSPSLIDKIGTNLESFSGIGGTKVVFGDVMKTIQEAEEDGLTATSLVSMVNNITDQSDFFKALHIGEQAAFIGALAERLERWGIPELIDSIIDKIRDARAKNALLETQAIRAAQRGDLHSCRYFCEKMGHHRSTNIMYKLIPPLMTQVVQPEDMDSKELGRRMLSFFNWLSPLWDRDEHDNSLVSLRYYRYCRGLATDALATTSKAKYALLAPRYTKVSPKTIFNDLFEG